LGASSPIDPIIQRPAPQNLRFAHPLAAIKGKNKRRSARAATGSGQGRFPRALGGWRKAGGNAIVNHTPFIRPALGGKLASAVPMRATQ
jgi:hypothetical protein